MYTIKHASEVTGLSPATLRAWERRYGVVTPQRTEAGYRLYDEQTFRALMLMAALVGEGWSPRQAADETRRRIESGEAAAGSSAPASAVTAEEASGSSSAAPQPVGSTAAPPPPGIAAAAAPQASTSTAPQPPDTSSTGPQSGAPTSVAPPRSGAVTNPVAPQPPARASTAPQPDSPVALQRSARSTAAPQPDVTEWPAEARGLGLLLPDAQTRVLTAEAEAFLDAAARLDVVGLTAILDERFSLTSFESVVDSWLMPSLVKLGDAWAQGRVSVAGEHLASYAVMRRLAAAYDASSAGATGPAVVVGLPPGARHELGVLAFAVAARRAGLKAVYLGADLPAEDWVTAVLTDRPRAVVLSAMQAADVSALDLVVHRLRDADPALIVAVGGALQERAPEGCLLLGHQIGAGATRLAETLASTPLVHSRPQPVD